AKGSDAGARRAVGDRRIVVGAATDLGREPQNYETRANWALRRILAQSLLFLFPAILFQFTIYRRFTTSDGVRISPMRARLIGSISLLLWLGVGLAGRAIGFD